jgi:pimeloyl-ACP methyl ester carboxylesterase
MIFEVSAKPRGAPDAWDHLAHISCPTTIVAGENTFLPDIFAAQAERAHAALVVVSGGHFVLHENTARGADLIAQYALP